MQFFTAEQSLQNNVNWYSSTTGSGNSSGLSAQASAPCVCTNFIAGFGCIPSCARKSGDASRKCAALRNTVPMCKGGDCFCLLDRSVRPRVSQLYFPLGG